MSKSDVASSHVDPTSTAVMVRQLVVTMHERYGLTTDNLETMSREDMRRTIAGWQFIINNLPGGERRTLVEAPARALGAPE